MEKDEMIDISIFILLNGLAMFFTIMILAFKQLPEEKPGETGWAGLSLLCAVIATIIWITVGVISLDIGIVQAYAVLNGGTIVTGTVSTRFDNTWPLVFMYILASIIPFILIFFFWPETWLPRKK
jgi:Mn2+/Fe2+ NRAMP family transporter